MVKQHQNSGKNYEITTARQGKESRQQGQRQMMSLDMSMPKK